MTRGDSWILLLHALVRSFEAATVSNKPRRDFVVNDRWWENNEPPKLHRSARLDLIDNVRERAQTDLRNALVIMKEPGYPNRAALHPNPNMERIYAISPQSQTR